MNSTEQNKAIVTRFNKEFLEGGNLDVLYELVSPDFINHTAAPGMNNGREGMIQFLQHVLKAAFPDLTVEIHDQLAEGDKVTTRKSFHATHTGPLMGIPPTQKKIRLDVIDIVILRNGQYAEHWGMSNMHSLLEELAGK